MSSLVFLPKIMAARREEGFYSTVVSVSSVDILPNFERNHRFKKKKKTSCRSLRDRNLITSQGGGVFGGGYNFKTSPFLEGKFFTGKKHEGGQIL